MALNSDVFCYYNNIMLSLSNNDQADVIVAFNLTSRYLDKLINIDKHYYLQMLSQIYIS